MIEEFTIPRWAKLLTRLAERRVRHAFNYRRPSRSIETREEILAALNEPFWDPVVEIADPWRRHTQIAAFDTSAREASEITPDRPFAAAPMAPISIASSELATRVNPAAATPPTATGVEDDRLTRQLLATARALSVTWARDIKTTDPDLPSVAAETPAVAADITPAVAPPAMADAPFMPDLPPATTEDAPPATDVAVAAELEVASAHTLQVEDETAPAETNELMTSPVEVPAVSETVSLDGANFETIPAMPSAAVAEEEPEAPAIAEADIQLQPESGISTGVFGTSTIAAEGLVAATAPLEPAVHLAEAAAAIESVSERGPVRRAEPDEMPEAEDVLENPENQSPPTIAEPADADAMPAYAAQPVEAEPTSTGEPSPAVTQLPPIDESAEPVSEASSEPITEIAAPNPAEEPAGTEDFVVAAESAVLEEADIQEEPGIAAPLSEATAAMPEAAAMVAEAVELMPAEPGMAAAEAPEAIRDAAEAVSAEEPQTAVADASSAPVAAVTVAEPAVAETPLVEPPATTEPTEPTAPAKKQSEVATEVAAAIKSAASTVMAPAVRDEYNRTNVDFRRPMPRPKVRGKVIDFHCHLLARRHAEDWFEAADHYGLDYFLTMSQLEEAVSLSRDWGHRIRFIAVPQWTDKSDRWVDNWRLRIEGFYNLGSRIAKFHASPGTMAMRGHRLDSPAFESLFKEVTSRGMAIMTHIGDPDTWYNRQYADHSKFGSRQEHYQMWETLLEAYRGHTWIGAHMGGNPEDLPRLQRLLDKFPDLWLDCSATRWMVREISARREPAREFFIRNADRILFGSDQVSGDDRHFDFLASRFWCHRKLWETAYIGPSPIIDPDLPNEEQPVVRGLALPDTVLQKIYHDNPTKLLAKIGMSF